MGVNHPKNIFFAILKNFGLSKPKKKVSTKTTFSTKMLQQKQHFQQMLIDPYEKSFHENNILIHVVYLLERIFDIATIKKIKHT